MIHIKYLKIDYLILVNKSKITLNNVNILVIL